MIVYLDIAGEHSLWHEAQLAHRQLCEGELGAGRDLVTIDLNVSPERAEANKSSSRRRWLGSIWGPNGAVLAIDRIRAPCAWL